LPDPVTFKPIRDGFPGPISDGGFFFFFFLFFFFF